MTQVQEILVKAGAATLAHEDSNVKSNTFKVNMEKLKKIAFIKIDSPFKVPGYESYTTWQLRSENLKFDLMRTWVGGMYYIF